MDAEWNLKQLLYKRLCDKWIIKYIIRLKAYSYETRK